MEDKVHEILHKIRDIALSEGITKITVTDICKKIKITKKELFTCFKNENEVVEKVLELERDSFKVIFDEFNFEGMNAIDILFIVSKEMARKYRHVTPSLTIALKHQYPEIYSDHVVKRIDFIFEKIKINLQKGISQGMYRSDFPIELVGRLYISRLIDLHNPEFFPPEKFSFQTLFEVMFENFVRSIATTEGLEYFELKQKETTFAY